MPQTPAQHRVHRASGSTAWKKSRKPPSTSNREHARCPTVFSRPHAVPNGSRQECRDPERCATKTLVTWTTHQVRSAAAGTQQRLPEAPGHAITKSAAVRPRLQSSEHERIETGSDCVGMIQACEDVRSMRAQPHAPTGSAPPAGLPPAQPGWTRSTQRSWCRPAAGRACLPPLPW